MKYWVFVLKDHKVGNSTFTALEMFKQRMQDKFWGIDERTPNRKNLSEGDKVVIYLASPEKTFVGDATFKSSCFKLDESQKEIYGHGLEVYMSDYGVLLKDINVWKNPKNVEELVPKLNFIEKKEFWYTYFQGGIRQIPEEDFKIIIGKIETISDTDTEDLEGQQDFVLEKYLEEFIYHNWSKINWGSGLELYKTKEQDGRQFPAGTWNIDFLAIDRDTNDLVVIELKRGRTSDSTVGQLLRYINWVKENIAQKDQNVRGIIIARDVDEALKYAVKGLDHVEVKTYEVNFKLHPFKNDISIHI